MPSTTITGIIRSEQQYQQVITEIESLMNTAQLGTATGDRLELLILLADTYEDQHTPIQAPDPIEAIKIVMEAKNLKQKDLAELVGAESRVSEILNRKRKLTLEMIRNISTKLNISVSTLIQDYQLMR